MTEAIASLVYYVIETPRALKLVMIYPVCLLVFYAWIALLWWIAKVMLPPHSYIPKTTKDPKTRVDDLRRSFAGLPEEMKKSVDKPPGQRDSYGDAISYLSPLPSDEELKQTLILACKSRLSGAKKRRKKPVVDTFKMAKGIYGPNYFKYNPKEKEARMPSHTPKERKKNRPRKPKGK